MIRNPEILAEHIEYLTIACEYWTQELLALDESLLGEVNRKEVPTSPGVYIIRHDGDVKYIGKSKKLRTRICSNHLGPRMRSSTLRRKVSKYLETQDESLISQWLLTATIAWLDLGHHPLTLAVEDHAIETISPPFNGYT